MATNASNSYDVAHPSTALGMILSNVEESVEAFVAIALDDLTRKYQDLVKRAADLRSYL